MFYVLYKYIQYGKSGSVCLLFVMVGSKKFIQYLDTRMG